MRFIARPALDAASQSELEGRQTDANRKAEFGNLDIAAEWKRARQSAPLRPVVGLLRSMVGERERCMYCLDSHATDVEHFWPKSKYPEKMFCWNNLLIACSGCERYKGDQFPLAEGQPLLVDPTAEDPWVYLDFDPQNGNIVARWDAERGVPCPKGQTTVELLCLDRREALAVGYRKTYRRLSKIVRDTLAQPEIDGVELATRLSDEDEHGLMGWCFTGAGQRESPFRELSERHPDAWRACVNAVALEPLRCPPLSGA